MAKRGRKPAKRATAPRRTPAIPKTKSSAPKAAKPKPGASKASKPKSGNSKSATARLEGELRIARDRQAERDARRQPYVSPGYGPIRTATAARNACAAKAREEAGPGARILGRIAASTMSTGWEVEGEVRPSGDSGAVPFVCSVRNGSVSGVLLQPDR